MTRQTFAAAVSVLLYSCALVLCPSAAASNARTSGWCEQGGRTVTTGASLSSTKVQQSYTYCTVTVYLSGTTTPATIYSDISGTPQTNPFTSDFRGYWYFYAADGTYDVRFSGGTPPSISTPFTLGDKTSIGYRKQGGTGSVDRNYGDKLYEFVSVKDFGAKCDGTTDDLAAFQAAQTYLLLSGGGTILVSGRNGSGINGAACIISDTFELGRNVHLVGEGRYATSIRAAGTFPPNSPVIRIGPTGSVGEGVFSASIEHIGIYASNVSGSTGIYSSRSQELTLISDVGIGEFDNYGINYEFSSAQNCRLSDLNITPKAGAAIGTGIRLNGVLSRVEVANASIIAPSGASLSSTGFLVLGSYGVIVRNVHIERYTIGLQFDGGAGNTAMQIYGHASIPTLIQYANGASGLAMSINSNGSAVSIDDVGAGYQNFGIVDVYIANVHRIPLLNVSDNLLVGRTGVDAALQMNGTNSRLSFSNSSGFFITQGPATNSYPSFRHASFSGILVQNYSNSEGAASGGLFLHGNGSTTGDPDRGEIAAGSTSDFSTHTARGTNPAGITWLGSGTYTGMRFWANSGVSIGSTFSPGIKMRVGPDAVQVYPTSVDPGCTATTDIGKIWVDNTTTTTFVRWCVSTSGSVAWKYVTLN